MSGMSTFQLEYRGYAQLASLIQGADMRPFRKYNLVVGIPRSGMVPAYMIGLRLNLPVIDLDGFLNGNDPSGGSRLKEKADCPIRHVLIVDDSIRSGSQLNLVKKKLNGFCEIKFGFCTPFASTPNMEQVDHYFELIDRPRVFQWNLMHSWIFEHSCVDIDGVLCDDPNESENDDGENYIQFLLNAPLKYKPAVPVKTLVTNRLEKYRPQTERWLSQNGIQYKELIMLNLPDRAARVRQGNYGAFKAEVYKSQKDALLFIESDRGQSVRINKTTGRPVFCVDEMSYYPHIDAKTPVHKRIIRKVSKYLRIR
jgi:uncharacterized HAD superfamily protein/hypoxanthine phosphoribosyltransferase